MGIALPDMNRGLGRFIGHPRTESLPAPPGVSSDYTLVRLIEDFAYHANDGALIVAPAGLCSDGASIPSPLWALLGHPLSSMNAPFGLIHDWLYRSGIYARGMADLYAFDMARCAGHSDKDAIEIYVGLHQFGFVAWNENAKKRAACGSDLEKLKGWA